MSLGLGGSSSSGAQENVAAATLHAERYSAETASDFARFVVIVGSFGRTREWVPSGPKRTVSSHTGSTFRAMGADRRFSGRFSRQPRTCGACGQRWGRVVFENRPAFTRRPERSS